MSRANKLALPVAASLACCSPWGCATLGRSDDHTLHQASRPLIVELLALDLSTCSRCTGTDRNIESAVRELRPVLAQVGVALQFRKTVVLTAEQAVALRFRSSPTVRINGQDVPIALRESRCSDCTELAGGSSCDCRVWIWQGREYTEAPKALIVDAVLRAYPSFDKPPPASNEAFELSENLKRFFVDRTSAAPLQGSKVK